MKTKEKFKPLPSFERLMEKFDYNPLSGILTYKQACQRIKVGEIAGSPLKSGYLVIGVDNGRYFVHRIIWKMMTGIDPDGLVDHENNDHSDNRWTNLRLATRFQNMCNSDVRSDNPLKLRGAHFTKSGKVSVTITADGERKRLGTFNDLEKASAEYNKRVKPLHGEFYFGASL